MESNETKRVLCPASHDEADVAKFPGGWKKGDTCYLITNKAKRYALPHTVESFDGTYFGVRGNTGLFHHVSLRRMFHSKEAAIASLETKSPKQTAAAPAPEPLVGRLTFANGDVLEFTDPDKYIAAFTEELDYKATTGMTHETLTDAPEVRKAIDDAIYNFFGEENSQSSVDYEEKPEMTMGGM